MRLVPVNGRPFADTADGTTIIAESTLVVATSGVGDAGRAGGVWTFDDLHGRAESGSVSSGLGLSGYAGAGLGHLASSLTLRGALGILPPGVVVPPILVPAAAGPSVTLGCGSYEVLFFPRGALNGSAVGSLPFTSLAYQRTLDAVSEATFKVTGLTGGSRRRAACAAVLGEIDTWTHELAIIRDDELVWAGPLTQIVTQGEDITITARDLAQWFYRRRLRHDHSFTATDLSVIFQAYVDDALSLDNSMRISVTATPCGVTGSREVLALEHAICGDQLDELTTTGIDWTAIGRSIRVGGAVIPQPLLATPPLLTDESFATPPEVTRDGMAMATDWLVRGAGGGAGPDSIYAEVGGVSATYGLVDQVASSDAILDTLSARSAAESTYALAGTPVALISQGVLSPSAGVRMSDLIPGVVFAVRILESALPVIDRSRLASIDVSVDASSDEQVTVNFQPEGTT